MKAIAHESDSESEKLLGVTIDNKLNFNNHLQKILKKANQKVMF